jgi:predicted GH43/DUF377 family glycosyl hydrolase
MEWIKKGIIYHPSGKNGFDFTHCHKPTPIIIDDNTVRVYFGTRDETNKTRTTFVDLNINDLSKVKYVHDKPVLDLGKLGAFDDSGVNVSSVVRVGSKIYMYYIGITPSITVHMRNAIGLAVSNDNGLTFERLYDGAVIDKSKDDPYYIGAVDVVREAEDKWLLYYTNGSEWKVINNKPEIFYHVYFGHSKDGINWERPGVLCIQPDNEFEATARPSVIFDEGIYKMYYSKRSLENFRTQSKNSYKAGYAESTDGIKWIRKDYLLNIPLSEEGWDSEMIAYPYLIKIKGRWVMFYNGNSFGKTGFGYAVLSK